MEPAPHHTLRIPRFHENDLASFLARHATTLKDVELVACTLYTGTLKFLCNKIRSLLKLEKFIISTALDEDRDEKPESARSFTFWDDNNSLKQDSYIEAAVRDAADQFVTRRTDKWPSRWMSLVPESRKDLTESDSEDEGEYVELGDDWFNGITIGELRRLAEVDDGTTKAFDDSDDRDDGSDADSANDSEVLLLLAGRCSGTLQNLVVLPETRVDVGLPAAEGDMH